MGNSLQEYQRIVESRKKLESLKNTQNVTKSQQNITENEQNITNSEKLLQIDFRVLATREQFEKLRDFLIENKIDFRRI